MDNPYAGATGSASTGLNLFGGGGITGSIFAGLGQMFSGRGSRKESKLERQMQQRLAEAQLAQQRNLANAQRRWSLEDRRYRADSMGNYAQFNTRQGIVRPDPVDTTVSEVQAPRAISGRDEQRRTGLMFFG